MVKGVSRQVIVVRPQDGKLYEQAIFILKDDSADVTDDMLLREAMQIVRLPNTKGTGIFWAIGGALCTGLVWLLTVLI